VYLSLGYGTWLLTEKSWTLDMPKEESLIGEFARENIFIFPFSCKLLHIKLVRKPPSKHATPALEEKLSLYLPQIHTNASTASP
jgi:hypothetical protein